MCPVLTTAILIPTLVVAAQLTCEGITFWSFHHQPHSQSLTQSLPAYCVFSGIHRIKRSAGSKVYQSVNVLPLHPKLRMRDEHFQEKHCR